MTCNNPVHHRIVAGDTLYGLSKRYGVPLSRILDDNPYANPRRLRIGDIITICLDEPTPMPLTPMHRPSTPAPAEPSAPMPAPWEMTQESMSDDKAHLRDAMREAWQSHVEWTRMVMNSLLHDVPDLQSGLSRLMESARAIADVFAPYYGPLAAEAIQKGIEDHIQSVGQWMSAAKKGEPGAMQTAEKIMRERVLTLARLLSNLNPHYSYEQLSNMLLQHISLIQRQVASIIAGDFAMGIDAFDMYEKQAREMADEFTRGIIQQFPQMF